MTNTTSKHTSETSSTKRKSTPKRQTPPSGSPDQHPLQLFEQAKKAPHTLTAGDVLQLQRAIGNRATQRLLTTNVNEINPIQRGTGKPKGLKYRSLSGTKRRSKLDIFKHRQKYVVYKAKFHVRHIIPHSDLQAWMLESRKRGNQYSSPGQMRRIIRRLLVAFGEGAEATNWNNDCLAYEGGGMNRSFLQEYGDTVNRIWRLIEWHTRNLFYGNGGINTAIQNRFDAGNSAFTTAHTNTLYQIWFDANTLLALHPTPIQDTRIYSTFLRCYIIVRTAEHDNSRPLVAAVGRTSRRGYIRLG